MIKRKKDEDNYFHSIRTRYYHVKNTTSVDWMAMCIESPGVKLRVNKRANSIKMPEQGWKRSK